MSAYLNHDPLTQGLIPKRLTFETPPPELHDLLEREVKARGRKWSDADIKRMAAEAANAVEYCECCR